MGTSIPISKEAKEEIAEYKPEEMTWEDYLRALVNIAKDNEKIETKTTEKLAV